MYARSPRSNEPLEHRRLRLPDALGFLLCVIVALLAIRSVVGRNADDLVAQAPDFDLARAAALLAVARRFAKEPPARNDLVVLFTDAEEDGLLGAAAFVRGDPLAKRVRAFVNFEARGTHGASAMYSATAGSAPLLRAF